MQCIKSKKLYYCLHRKYILVDFNKSPNPNSGPLGPPSSCPFQSHIPMQAAIRPETEFSSGVTYKAQHITENVIKI